MSKELRSVRWILTEAIIPSFLIQLVISTLGAILAGTVVVGIPSVLTAALTKNTSGGDFVDHVADQPFFILLNQPYFVAPVIAGFCLGWLGVRFFRSLAAAFVWIVPAATLIVIMASGPNMNVWDTYFSKNCGASECAYELLTTLPFYTSVAYTLGWLCKNLRQGKGGRVART